MRRENRPHDYKQALALFTEIKPDLGRAHTLKSLGDLQVRQDHLKAAAGSYKHALALSTEIKDDAVRANTLRRLGVLQVRAQQFASPNLPGPISSW